MLFIRPIETHMCTRAQTHTPHPVILIEREATPQSHTPLAEVTCGEGKSMYESITWQKKPSSWKLRSFEIKLFSSNTHKDRNQNEVMNALFLFMSNWIPFQKAALNRQQQSVSQWPTVEKCGWTGLPADGEKTMANPPRHLLSWSLMTYKGLKEQNYQLLSEWKFQCIVDNPRYLLNVVTGTVEHRPWKWEYAIFPLAWTSLSLSWSPGSWPEQIQYMLFSYLWEKNFRSVVCRLCDKLS